MNRTEFDEFVVRQQASKSNAAISFDPKKQLLEWKTHLDALYSIIQKFVAPYVEQGSAKVEFRDIQLNEEFSGPYDAPQMLLIFGQSTVVFKPIGTMLIGSKGRVDVQGPRGTARVGLVNRKIDSARQMLRASVHAPASSPPPLQSDEPIEWVWKIITPAPDMRLLDLTEPSFFDMILSVADA